MKDNLLYKQRMRLARLVIADDHELVRAGLRAMLTGQRGLEVVGEAIDGHEALELCRRVKPDLALIDIRMPEQDGLGTCRAIRRECPATSVILISVYENVEYILDAIKVGAAGYLLKDVSQHELITTIRRALRGELILDHELVIGLLRRWDGQTPGREKQLSLSPRECEVLRLLTYGQTNREIAKNLMVSVSTVKIHVEHILAKLGVSDRTQAAVHAIELGLFETTSEE